MLSQNDTIAAIATAPGEAGVAIVKISGPLSGSIIESLCRLAFSASSLDAKSLKIVKVYSPEVNRVIDEAVLLWMPGPASYTREDVAEIQCHGGRAAAACILDAVLALGARLAEPGEFTLRACLNGRIDLLQAEAVLDVINAATSESLQVHEEILSGMLSEEVRGWSGLIVRSLMYVEGNLDFSDEEDITFDFVDALVPLEEAINAIKSKLLTFEWGSANRVGLVAVLTGAPNTGKSSLLNRFAGEERVIVSPLPGTTRDTVDIWVNAGGVPVRFIDTAGIRQSGDCLEMEGVARARRAISSANVILFISDGGRLLTDDEVGEAVGLSGKTNVIPVINKIDLGERPADRLGDIFSTDPHLVSAVTGEGIEHLLSAIKAYAGGGPGLSSEAPLTRKRHKICLESALECLIRAKDILEAEGFPEVAASEMHAARSRLGELIGEGAPEDVLNAVFSEFCIGK